MEKPGKARERKNNLPVLAQAICNIATKSQPRRLTLRTLKVTADHSGTSTTITMIITTLSVYE